MRNFKYSIIASITLTIALAACGGNSGTSVNDDNVSSSSSSSVIPASSGNRPSSSSKKIASSSSTPRNDVKSSSSKRSEGDPSSSSQKITSSSSVKTVSSSSVALSSSSKQSSSSKKVESSSSSLRLSSANLSSSSKKVESSSSEYVPFDHFKCLADNWNLRDSIYKTFVDPRNGRSYYYYTATSYKTGRSVTVMAENLNIGEMVLGENDQNDDTKMERYCYNNDTTYCDKYGGLYQWAEMMQLPSRCNTESCYKKIESEHQGICPDGWRLFTWHDYEIVKDYYDKYDEGIPLGLRSQCFSGYNTSGFSLIGAGARTINGGFEDVNETFFWRYPQEHEYDKAEFAYAAYVSRYSDDATGTAKNRRAEKIAGYSVRCTKIE
ncbi:FISUMP domain-containing protein [Fibrobacter succinogenes]|uniref:FISUMP domain-containing protein n=1 Tax=Fibrobacter succinogenes TaxID=833 RepID=UPI0015697B46|nr:FISUMP domain-containing protein [Fibrobacter succinogenes]